MYNVKYIVAIRTAYGRKILEVFLWLCQKEGHQKLKAFKAGKQLGFNVAFHKRMPSVQKA
jgi:hypothetical protein